MTNQIPAEIRPLLVSECEQRLQLWAKYNGQEDGNGIVWPSSIALEKTREVLSDYGEDSMPMFLSLDADGGVSLECRAGGDSVRVLIDSDGAVIQRDFRDSKLINSRSC